MSVKTVTNFKVEIWDIEVDSMYFSFQYKVYRDGGAIKEGEYEDDHTWDKPEDFKKD